MPSLPVSYWAVDRPNNAQQLACLGLSKSYTKSGYG